MSLRDAQHPIWKLAQLALILIGFLLIAEHGGAEVLGIDDGVHATEAIGVSWLLRELIAWRRA